MIHTTFDTVEALLSEVTRRRARGHKLVTFSTENPPSLGVKDKTDDSTFTVPVSTLHAHYGLLGPFAFIFDLAAAYWKGEKIQAPN
jgi:hypothetical protein